VAATDAVCLEHLDEEDAGLCRKVVGKLGRKRPCPLTRGDLGIWAAGVVYVVGQLNFVVDPAQTPHASADQLSAFLRSGSSDVGALLAALVARARTEAATVMMGRTHSVHAEPTTLGLKLAGWAFELHRGRVRLAIAVDEIGTGKISGPVGTYSHLDPDLEAEVLAALGLHADPVSTQIVQRDRHAALLTAMAIVGGSLERFATEIRNLQHTEIGELQEPFRAGQKGSSAMPHKRNPILSERIAGLARLLRGYASTALENQPLWHERDISHSSAERVILPDGTILLDYMLVKMTGLIEGLVVRGERMRENIERGLGLQQPGPRRARRSGRAGAR